MNWHAGELAMQRRAGVSRVRPRAGMFHASLPDPARAFLATQTLVAVAWLDADEPVAGLIAGPPGFAADLNGAEVHIALGPTPDPALVAALEGRSAPFGLLGIEPATRRRMRVNGRARVEEGRRGRRLAISTDEVFSNCPKYIQARAPESSPESFPSPARGAPRAELSEDDRARLRRADTIFTASGNAALGLDASHRGGEPGFLKLAAGVDGELLELLELPDYSGNLMFQTLGNILEDGRLSILVPDFQRGDAIELRARAEIRDEVDPARHPGAQRLVILRPTRIQTISGLLTGPWTPPESSPANPRLA